MGRYKWVRHNGDKLFAVGILDDGSLHNPNGYPEDIVRAAVLAADARRHERRSNAAKQAAETKAERRKLRVYRVAVITRAGQTIGPRRDCYVCGRSLSDPPSIERGIGSECWQDVLAQITELRRMAESVVA